MTGPREIVIPRSQFSAAILADYVDDDIIIIDDVSDDAPPIVLPYNYEPRFYQAPLWGAMFPDLYPQFKPKNIVEAVKRALLVWHRRAGKDKTVVNILMVAASKRPGLYLYMLPTAEQARLVVWQGAGKDGMRFIDHFPEAFVKAKYEQRMEVHLTNGSIIKLTGSDTFDRKMGSNPLGIVFSEFSISDPGSYDFFRPILSENDGWAVFIYTPRGKNHGWLMYEKARSLSKRQNPTWFCSFWQTLYPDRQDFTGAIPASAIEDERDSGMSDEMIEQEYGCSFEAMSELVIFGRQMKAAYDSGRIVEHIPWRENMMIHTFWDLGVRDTMFIIFAQAAPGNLIEIPLILQDRGYALGHYIKKIKSIGKTHDLRYGKHYPPHDIEVREMGAGDGVAKTRKRKVKEEHGFKFEDGKQWDVEDQIEAARSILPKCVISEAGAMPLISALTSYQYEDVDKREPRHDWASHGSSAMMRLAVSWRKKMFGDSAYEAPKVINLFESGNPLDVG